MNKPIGVKKAKAIANKYYGDIFSQLESDGQRCWVFGPSIFQMGPGAAGLLIDKNSAATYELYSGIAVHYGDLMFQDYESNLGYFTWPEGGGAPEPDHQKLRLLDKIAKQEGKDVAQYYSQPPVDSLLDAKSGAEQKLADALLVEADVAIRTKEFDKAAQCYDRAGAILKTCKTGSSEGELIMCYFAWGTLYLDAGNPLKAIKPFQKALAVFLKSKSRAPYSLVAVVIVQSLGACFTSLGQKFKQAKLNKLAKDNQLADLGTVSIKN